VGVALQEL